MILIINIIIIKLIYIINTYIIHHYHYHHYYHYYYYTAGKSADDSDYKAKQAHVELAQRMKQRDAGSAPNVGKWCV